MCVVLNHAVDGPETAPVLLLVGSLGATLEMWRPQVAPLAEHLRVVRVDLRGHGGSPVPPGPYTMDGLGGDLLATLDALGVESAHLAGLSLGGMVVMSAAVRAPGRVRSLALLCTSADTGPAQPWLDRAKTVREEGPGALAPTVVSRWLTAPYAEEHPELVAWLRGMVAATPREGYAGCAEAIAGFDLTGALPAVTAPTLVVTASEDRSLPAEHGERIAALVPGARRVHLEGVAHVVSVERADDVTRLLLEHVREAESIWCHE